MSDPASDLQFSGAAHVAATCRIAVVEVGLDRAGPTLVMSEQHHPGPATHPAPTRLDGIPTESATLLGTGDAIWRAAAAVSADIVCVACDRPCDGRTIDRLTRPLINDPHVVLVNGFDDAGSDNHTDPSSGDRLTEIVGRPLIARYAPALADLRQPLLHTFAMRTSVLRALPIPIGAGWRLSLLIDVHAIYGRASLAEVALDGIPSDERPLRALGPEAAELIIAVSRRTNSPLAAPADRFVVPWDDLAVVYLQTEERPPVARAQGS